jgi:ATP-dependent DNA helicase RecG
MTAQSREKLGTPLASLPGLAPRARVLSKLGLRTTGEALFYFPRDYDDCSDLRPIGELEADTLQTIRGHVTEVDTAGSGFGKSRVGVLVSDGTQHLRATWFNQPFMRDKFKVGQFVQFSGKPRNRGGRWEMAHPGVAWLDELEESSELKLLPVYSSTDGITQYHLRRAVALAVDHCADEAPEVLPERLRQQWNLLPVGEAIRQIHEPASREQLAVARRRFVFQELLVLQLALAARRYQQRVNFSAPELPCDARLAARIERLLPFELTSGQRKAVHDMTRDMARTTPMNRLLQGDVGSGKTIVALYALLVCVAAGQQAALLAPTEILARQHARTLGNLLAESRVRHELLVGGLKPSERTATLARLAAGEIDVVIGTHAILQEGVTFARLGLAVIDEQHKFGVRQRAALRQGDRSPHYLVMTATPIPRTVSMTQFGDLEVSTVTDMPPGRQPVSTYVVAAPDRDRWWHFVRNQLHEGRQAFVVVPLVEESENIQAVSVDQAFEALTNGRLAEFRVGMLHGRMSPAEKEATMAEFVSGKLQVLVSTTVIEVGVDVPNASIMMIASPERFGLAQLHQLRGRVGRGAHAGYCAVMVTEGISDEATARLQSFASTTSGFELAEIDFRMRGPGDLFGTQQSGLPPLRIADLARDTDLLLEARQAAFELYRDDPGLSLPDVALLRKQMLSRYGDALALGDVG